jgi:hypothetical protein
MEKRHEFARMFLLYFDRPLVLSSLLNGPAFSSS